MSDQDISIAGQQVSTTAQNVGAIVRLDPPKSGDIYWTATQVSIGNSLPPPGKAPKARHEINWSFGPLKITGYLDTTTLEIGVTVSVLGITMGNIYGNLKDGVGLKFDVFLAKGEVKLYLKNGNELWVHIDVSVRFDGNFKGDYKILSW
ncbi:hypothetical protein ISF_07873 [Cordyceps fumosorosea ARSEF 2679]|uniref:Uncharacterized protein n=1 Tax=Cordyceps fumosorosea (strain ARSEF 2679) TaxID=1081104 RepID=A0A167NBN0_CORFA|nr:hypothetical protein ISF_07873 [Cordyceps fumosorosea ARSEF 2679]OAA55362.1 hypothetical protein ISF_07873 [Cordyceps fumosorosea ARSEF 2679]